LAARSAVGSLLRFPVREEKQVAIGGVLIIIGIILLFWKLWLGIILIILGLLFGGFRRGRWY
jgi:hypothetical protein